MIVGLSIKQGKINCIFDSNRFGSQNLTHTSTRQTPVLKVYKHDDVPISFYPSNATFPEVVDRSVDTFPW